jgi:ABC-2 type transport system ATP-binding protein
MQAERAVMARLRGARKRYGAVDALCGIDLEFRGGELLALLGPNGAGKTTAIGLLLGLIRADAGTVELFGRDPHDIDARRRIGVMLQDAALPPTLKVGELLRLAASYYPAPRSVAEAADLAGITDLLVRPYAKLSGGQQRRVQFAVALVGRPQLLFLDEPTVGMDIQARQKLWAAIRTLVAEGCGVVLTTHYLEEAEALADRVCVVAHGRIVSEGSVEALRARVARKRVWCETALPLAQVAAWPEVAEAVQDGERLCLATEFPELLVRRLLAEDLTLCALEVRAAGLAEAFTELTDAADAATRQREAA